jgi:hypothetical protein
MTFGEWIADELEGVSVQQKWNPQISDEYRKGYIDALHEVKQRLTPRSERCPLPQSE